MALKVRTYLLISFEASQYVRIEEQSDIFKRNHLLATAWWIESLIFHRQAKESVQAAITIIVLLTARDRVAMIGAKTTFTDDARECHHLLYWDYWCKRSGCLRDRRKIDFA